jgi:hypothetical protein
MVISGELKMANIEKAWADACRSLLGGEVGPMSDYTSYLKKDVVPIRSQKSELSGKEVIFTGDYTKPVKVISHDEMARYQDIILGSELNINEIKDIDSIVDALRGNIYYTGNSLLGNSRETLLSNRVFDSQYVYDSHEVFYSKFVAHSHIVKYGTYIFGSESAGKNSNFLIKGYEIYEASGMVECLRVYHSTYCTYSANLEQCADCIFCFNLRAKKRCIGNLELPPDKYKALKGKLQEDIRATLRSRKELPMLIEMIGEGDL